MGCAEKGEYRGGVGREGCADWVSTFEGRGAALGYTVEVSGRLRKG